MHSIVSFQIVVFPDIDVKFNSKIGRKVITFSENAKEIYEMFILLWLLFRAEEQCAVILWVALFSFIRSD